MKKDFDFKIGGEFDINPNVLNGFLTFDFKENDFLFSTGRSALMAILRFISKTKSLTIYIPYYICQSVLTACINMGFKVHFYELNDNYLFPIESINILEKDATLLTVNYFGFINDNSLIQEIKKVRPDLITISDQVQSFWTYKESLADFSFTSLRKHLPLPDGALVSTKNTDWKIDTEIKENIFHKDKLIGAVLKNSQVDEPLYLRYFESGEKILNQSMEISKSSNISHYLLKTINLEQTKQQRIDNYRFIYENGSKFGLDFLFPYSKNIIPLCIPILIENRDEVRKELMTKNIFLPIHWPLMHFNRNSKTAKRFAQNELSIVIDQRYTFDEIEFELLALRKAINNERK